MTTLKLKKKTPDELNGDAPLDAPRRRPLRGYGPAHSRPTLSQAKAQRAARDEEAKRRYGPSSGHGDRRPDAGRSRFDRDEGSRFERPRQDRDHRFGDRPPRPSHEFDQRRSGPRPEGRFDSASDHRGFRGEHRDRPERPRFDRSDASPRPHHDRRSFSGHGSADRPRLDREPRDQRGPRSFQDHPRFDDRRSSGEHPRESRAWPDRPRHDRPSFDRPRHDREHGDRPPSDRPRFDRPHFDRPRGDGEHRDRRDGAPHRSAPRGFDRPQRPSFQDHPRFRHDSAPHQPRREEAPRAHEAPQRIHEAPSDWVRLSKRISELGLASRREADEWIEHGWVTVNGEVVSELGARVAPDAKIDIDPQAQEQQARRVTILLNKPIGYVSGQAEDGHDPAIVLIRSENRWNEDRSPTRFNHAQLKNLAPAGRLDIDSTGLLVLTQDGRIAKHLIGEDSPVEKEYLVRVIWEQNPDATDLSTQFPSELLDQLRHGLSLDDTPLKPAKVSWQNEQQLRFALREGKKRQIRRMCELVGLKVTALKRIRMGSIVLGNLPVGQWRYLGEHEKF